MRKLTLTRGAFKLLLACAALVLLSCASAPHPERTRYLMRSTAEGRSSSDESQNSFGLRRVTVAAYLKPQGLVLETEENEVRSARYYEWAEPLAQGLRSLLRTELSAQLGYDIDDNPSMASRWDYAVDVDVDQLHGTPSGEAFLVASWRITNVAAASELARHRFTRKQPLAREGYAALAEAEIALARQLAAAIAESLQELSPRAPSKAGE